jgi:hypothetical protein
MDEGSFMKRTDQTFLAGMAKVAMVATTAIAAVLTVTLTPSAQAQLVVEKQGRAPAPNLKIKTSKVPQFDLLQKQVVNGKVETVRAKEIPRLDLGEEARVKAAGLKEITLPEIAPIQFQGAQELTPPNEIFIDQYLLKEIPQVAEAKVIVPTSSPRLVPAAPKFVEPPAPITMQPEPRTLEIQEMAPNRMKLLQALIFLEVRKNYNLALGLLAELIEDPELRTEASFQLALTSKGLGLYSEYRHQMMKVLNDNNKDWQKRAVVSLAQNAQSGDNTLVEILDPKIEAMNLEVEGIDQFNINRAKYYLSKNDLTKALSATDSILMDSPLYTDTLYLKSLVLYKGGQLQEAIGLQQSVLADVMEKRPASEFRSIVALSLARMHFQASQYKEAFDAFLKVDKKHPEWTQAMVEQAWAQILTSDFEGAAGNMFSLHTDFFKKAFNPESYVVRTVGYLNLCQYGDGAKVVYDMKRKYTPVIEKLTAYEKAKTTPIQFYDTVKQFAKAVEKPEVDGLPREFIFYLTRHPKFLDEVENINSFEDQITKYNKATLDIIKLERIYLEKQNSVRAKLVELRKRINATSANEQKVALEKDADQLEKALLSYRIEHHIAKKARNSIKDLRTAAFKRIDSDKQKTLAAAGGALKERFTGMLNTLKTTLDQAEVLQYELYSGAGEHIRYQMAGGEINEKEREKLKVEGEKAMTWDFRGEVWEDEIGHFRSGLKNVCPPEETIGALDTRE